MPYRHNKREYRSFAASDFKPVTRDNENEPSDEPTYRVKGYFSVFSSEYELFPRTKYWPAEYEQIDPHAFDEADMSDVIFQLNHEGAPLARQRNGSLTVGVDEHGAWCEAYLGGCQQGRDLFESIQNGLIVEMSFGFTIYEDDDSVGYTTYQDEEGDYHTTITRIRKVFDCSAVSIPASPFTEISEKREKRSYLSATIEADRKAEEEKRLEEERKAVERESLRRRKAKLLQLQSL